MLEQNNEDLAAWRNQMKAYQKQKRTKKPFGKEAPLTEHVTHKIIKQKETVFNPVLQVYNDPVNQLRRTDHDEFMRAKSLMNHLKHTRKYQRPFDIVNLHSAEQNNISTPEPNGKKLGPLRNAYNVINNTKLPDFYFHNRQMRLPVQRQKNLIQNNPKQYNIVTGLYYKNNEQRTHQQQQQQKQTSSHKYWKTHDYDPVFGKYYDTEKEKQYQEERAKLEKQHGKDYQSKLPPSYHLPESLQTIDEKRMNAKKRYQLKYCIEDQYGRRNVQDQDKHEQVIRNRVHNGRIEEHKAKQFDIITMKQYDPNRAEQLFNKQNIKSTWQKLQSEPSKIKTGGFS